jgi:glycosyltransferase involved in cell wall biosynthesis
MNICLITSGRPLDVYGGEEKFTNSFGDWLSKRGINVTIVGRKLFGVIAVSPEDLLHDQKKSIANDPQVLRFPYFIYAIFLIFTSLLLTLKILAVNKKSRLTILHVQDTGYGGFSGIIAGKLLGIPVVVSSHGLRYKTIKDNLKGVSKISLPFELALDGFVSRRANVLIIVSLSEKDFFINLKVKESKIVKIPIGIKISDFQFNEDERTNTRKQLNCELDLLIGFIGRLSPEKNVFSLLKAFAQASKLVDIKLLIVGSGPVEQELKIFSRKQGLISKTIFTGAKTDIRRFLCSIDIFILPSFTEGCPTALLEAMTIGKPIIASNIPSVTDILQNGKDSILFSPSNIEELKRAILTLGLDSDLRERFSKVVKTVAKKYDINVVFPQILDVYFNLQNIQHKF